jgi:threonine/homoserine/homoserine lactone efflux protein
VENSQTDPSTLFPATEAESGSVQRAMDRITGTVLIGFGIKLTIS